MTRLSAIVVQIPVVTCVAFGQQQTAPPSITAKLEVSEGDGPWVVTFATKGVKIK